ncbi:DUF3157 family protein [Vibrio zhugei]|uniref:DUF3157 family protein n=1 Tax=Vibrio zhugei TaxID=2479546 RepID=A0ABV7C8S7_9VIBR|nr:DUF3157 family protein [Vibrio zhugei]
MKRLWVFCLSLSSGLAGATQMVTLQDGRKVQLNSDFTWQYVQQQTDSAMQASPTQPADLAAPIIAHKMERALITVDKPTPLMQLSRSDIDVVLGATTYQDGNLSIPTALTNQGQQSAIEVTLQWQIRNQQDAVIRSGKQVIWQSIKRMGSTYLRPATSQAGKTLHIDVAANQYHTFAAEISHIELR